MSIKSPCMFSANDEVQIRLTTGSATPSQHQQTQDYQDFICQYYKMSSSSCAGDGRPNYDELTTPIIDEANSEIAAWAAIICALFGGVGNVLTIYVLLRKRGLRIHSTTPFILSLAFSDLLFCLVNLPLTAVRFFQRRWIFPLWTCKLFPFFFYANISISALSMAFVALNRYVGVYHGENMMDKWFSRWRSVSYIGLIWALSFGLMLIPYTKTWGQLGYEPQIFNCTIMEYYCKSPMKPFLIVGCGLPCLVISFCYAKIYWKVKQTGHHVLDKMDQDVTNLALERQIRKREAQITKTTLMIWLGYGICFLPTTLIMAFDPMPPNKDHPGLHVAGYIIFWCSGFINPIIYIVSNKYYRKAMIDSLCGTNQFEEMFIGEVMQRTSSFVRTSYRKISNSLRPQSSQQNASFSVKHQNVDLQMAEPEETIEFKRDS